MTTLSVTIDAAGVHVPAFSTVLAGVQAIFQSIYGPDIYLGVDQPDGQLAAALALMVSDCNNACAAAIANFSPQTAVGVALSSMVKLNGIERRDGTFSNTPVVITGEVGTILRNCLVSDSSGIAWALATPTTIPISGTIAVLATCTAPGPITAGPNTLTRLLTPVSGWQTATNPAAAAVGVDTESDGALRTRQTQSTGSPALTLLASILAAVRNVPGVTNAAAYNNDTSTTDTNGIPARSFAIVASGGDPVAICTAIMNKKGIGAATVGTTSVTLINSVSNPETIKYTVPVQVPIKVNITLKALTGFTLTVRDEVVAALVASQASNTSGKLVEWATLFPPALLNLDVTAQAAYLAAYGQPAVPADNVTYSVQSLLIYRGTLPPAAADIGINYNELATMATADVTVTVV